MPAPPSDRGPRGNFLAGPYLDRRSSSREDDAWLEAALADPLSRFILARGTAQLVHTDPRPGIAYLRSEHDLVRSAPAESMSLLGWLDDLRIILIDSEASGEATAPLPGARFEELRPLAPLLDGREAAVLAYARALTYWRSRHRYCGICGTACAPTRAGHVMTCSNVACATDFFPRLDPAIIVLVTDGERALLGRQASWPAGRYSTIAGFVEPGESLEDAVVREVLEETTVPVIDTRYHSSQPWPFPSSLMVGYHATAQPGAVARGDSELEDARWFTREDIASGTPMLPPSVSISYRLIEDWFDAGSAVPLAAQTRAGRWDAAPRSQGSVRA